MALSSQSGYLLAIIPVLLICCLTQFDKNIAYAGQVYKSIDADGNVSYSSIPPKDAVQIERMKIPARENPAEKTPEDTNIERMKDLANEMEKERIQREDDRAAVRKKRDESLEKKQAEEAKKQAEKKAAEQQDRYYPIYVPVRPGHPVKPGHPVPEHRLH